MRFILMQYETYHNIWGYHDPEDVGEPWIQDHSIDKMIKLFGKGRLWVYEV